MYISFSAILPAPFETASLVNCIFRLDNIRIQPLSSSRAKLVLLIFLGAVCLILPLIFPITHLYALIWLGFLLLIDPVNYLLGLPSFLKERRNARIYRFFSFFIGGYICGFLWEFWNWYSYASWIYNVPFFQNIKIFQMPVLGFLGFGPFSLEMFCMYYFTWYILRKTKIISSPYVEI